VGGPHLKGPASNAKPIEGRFDHIDLRVRDLAKVRGFYDTLMPALGFQKQRGGTTSRTYAQDKRHLPFLWLVQAKTSAPGPNRAAFALASIAEVDRVARLLKRIGARKVEGPQHCRSYGLPYYAVFFEDPDGNRLEACCRR